MTAIAIFVLTVTATPAVVAQNMTGGNMTGGNITGANMTGMVSSVEGTGCPVSAEGIPDEFCLQDKPRDESQDEGENQEQDDEEQGGGRLALDSRQIVMIIGIVAALSASIIATPVMAQNMTGGNMTGGNMTGGNMTGNVSSAGLMSLTAQGAQDVYLTSPTVGGPGQTVPTEPGDVEGQDEGQDDAEEQKGGN